MKLFLNSYKNGKYSRPFFLFHVSGYIICVLVLLFLFFSNLSVHYACAGKDEKVSDFKKRLDAILKPSTYNYSAAGKVDPFQPFLETTYNKEQRPGPVTRKKKKKRFQPPRFCASKLECMDVGQLTLVAIIKEGPDTTIAMAQDASGLGYVLKPGMRLGYRNGRIQQITLDRVVVVEDYENINGEISTRKRILFLHPEEK